MIARVARVARVARSPSREPGRRTQRPATAVRTRAGPLPASDRYLQVGEGDEGTPNGGGDSLVIFGDIAHFPVRMGCSGTRGTHTGGASTVHRFRSLFIALVVLGLSAGAVFASKSISDVVTASNSGLDRAQAAAGQQLPASAAALQGKHDGTAGTDNSSGTDETTGTDDTSGTDSSTGTGKPTDNHGAVVSAAAHLSFDQLKAKCTGATDGTGFTGKNKGAYMSAIARGILVVTLGTTTDGSTGSTSVVLQSCTLADASAGTTAPTVSGTAPTGAPTGNSTKLHGQANAAAKRLEHQPQQPDIPQPSHGPKH